ncbi:hypothetical protein [Solidesulfovibrio magneticus]|uniref:Uncharacterized protein n=1 Tax=Solidesulfovibrio magneticus (strain ATCC 700980 / DSM 13731 / RS-1) TaxID=573370 RepID=C4XM01_SOLM1|nr:hypothetical protein [Solidesulfovibrio magneticus]BAH77129.1 hypothetical protein DMR_36380 [Solidesulfovibrio magneticus RS-1]
MDYDTVYLTWDDLKERGWSRLLMLAYFGGPDIVLQRSEGQQPLELFEEESVVSCEIGQDSRDFFDKYSELVSMAMERKLFYNEKRSNNFCESFDLLIDMPDLDTLLDRARTEYDRRMFLETGDEFHPDGETWSDSISEDALKRVAVLMLKNSSNINTALSHLKNIKHGLAELGMPSETYMSCVDKLYDKFYTTVKEKYPDLESAALELKQSETIDGYTSENIYRIKSIFN